MSVLANDRGESSVELLDVARRLQAETLDFSLKLPKRLTFFLSTEIMRWGHEVYNHAKAANSIYIARRSDVDKRRDHWIEGNNALQILDGKMTLADVRQSYNSWRGHAARARSHKTIKSMDGLFRRLFGEESLCLSS